jgi:hypothetical protein
MATAKYTIEVRATEADDGEQEAAGAVAVIAEKLAMELRLRGVADFTIEATEETVLLPRVLASFSREAGGPVT